MVMCTCPRPISYLMAEASWKRRIVGDLARALQVIPVTRAQDVAVKGAGRIQMNATVEGTDQGENKDNSSDKTLTNVESTTTTRMTVQGHEGTQFTTQTKIGDKIQWSNDNNEQSATTHVARIVEIHSDTHMIVECIDAPSPTTTTTTAYDILPQVPLQQVFGKVLDRLALHGAIGIFPEGGSHDRTDLLPLKIGIALVAYQALDTHGLRVPVVPVGLSYFRAHRWRGRAVVEYGKPVYVDPATLPQFRQQGPARHQVCDDFLLQIEDAMRSVLVQSPDYETLQLLHTARRLYQEHSSSTTTLEKQDLARRFTVGYQRMLQQMPGGGELLPTEWLSLQQRLKEYAHELKELGLKDYQVNMLVVVAASDDPQQQQTPQWYLLLQWIYAVGHLIVLLAIAAIPTLALNLPVGVLAGLYSERRRRTALQKSKVKIHGYDVMLTEKVVFCIIMVPTLWFLYFLLLKFGTNLEGPAIALIMLSLPVFSYIGIVVAQAGMVGWNDLRPHLMLLFPTTRSRLQALPVTRRALQKDLRAFIKRIGPELGDLYYENKVDWAALQETYRRRVKEESVVEASKKEQ